MLALIKVLAMAGSGIALGLAATWITADAGLGFGAVRAGVWQAWPKSGTNEIDPYTRARLARSGEIPLGLAEGLSLLATRDESGEPLLSNCLYALTGRMPPARYWTLTLMDTNGYLIGSRDDVRHGLTSAEILRRADGAFFVQISRNARPGNWLPLHASGEFMVALRLYDTAISSTASVIEAGTLPRLTREACL